jgi:hypothetical protein
MFAAGKATNQTKTDLESQVYLEYALDDANIDVEDAVSYQRIFDANIDEDDANIMSMQ